MANLVDASMANSMDIVTGNMPINSMDNSMDKQQLAHVITTYCKKYKHPDHLAAGIICMLNNPSYAIQLIETSNEVANKHHVVDNKCMEPDGCDDCYSADTNYEFNSTIRECAEILFKNVTVLSRHDEKRLLEKSRIDRWKNEGMRELLGQFQHIAHTYKLKLPVNIDLIISNLKKNVLKNEIGRDFIFLKHSLDEYMLSVEDRDDFKSWMPVAEQTHLHDIYYIYVGVEQPPPPAQCLITNQYGVISFHDLYWNIVKDIADDST